MKSDNQHNEDGMEGILGMYYPTKHPFTDEPRICFESDTQSNDIEILHGFIYIPKSQLAAFCTELIEMARVLGVTGGQDGT